LLGWRGQEGSTAKCGSFVFFDLVSLRKFRASFVAIEKHDSDNVG